MSGKNESFNAGHYLNFQISEQIGSKKFQKDKKIARKIIPESCSGFVQLPDLGIYLRNSVGETTRTVRDF